MRKLLVWSSVLLLLSAAGLGKKLWRWLKPPHAPALTFERTDGSRATLNDPQRPSVVGFVIEPCPYSDRVLAVMQQLRERHGEPELGLTALYLNPVSPGTLASLADRHGIAFAAAQQTPAHLRALQQAFDLRGAGADLYVVSPGGRIRRVDMSAQETRFPDLLEQVERALAASR